MKRWSQPSTPNVENLLILISLLLALITVAGVLWFAFSPAKSKRARVQEALERAHSEALKALQNELQQLREAREQDQQKAEKEAAELRQTLRSLSESQEEQRIQLEVRTQILDTRETLLQHQLEALTAEQTSLQAKQAALAGLTPEAAREQLLAEWEQRLAKDLSQRIRQYQAHLNEQCEKMAGKILAQAIQRTAVDHVVERTVTVVPLPNEELKGRIIGREGRNIRALEMATGVELLVDDTPEVVVISCFDPIRREVARRTLEKLIEDGRIHPTRIEEVVEKVREELDRYLIEEGEAAALEVGVQNLHPEVIRLLGRLRYRSSYGQNILQHSKEVAYTAGIMAAEIGANPELARRAGLLHDLGKALTYEEVGTHTALGIDAARRYGEKPEVLHAMAAHHFDVEPQTLEAVLVQVADTLSAARPGARKEPVELYMQRMRALEQLVSQFKGVQRAFVIQAGREVRVMVEPDTISEDSLPKLAFEIAQKVEQELDYPGQIKISLIRETRANTFAR